MILDPRKIVLEEAEKSKCIKRRVGAVITDKDNNILCQAHNYTLYGSCEDSDGNTLENVIHAERAALSLLKENQPAYKIYVTHEPCHECHKLINEYSLEVIIVRDYLKFDTDKLRYDLVPSEAYKGLAEVVTFGARKYKPNNWRTVDDIHRFMAALERHYQEFKYVMETGDCTNLYDEDTKLHTLKHVICNAAFILELVKDEQAVGAWREKLS